MGVFLRIDSRGSIRANRPDSRCDSPARLCRGCLGGLGVFREKDVGLPGQVLELRSCPFFLYFLGPRENRSSKNVWEKAWKSQTSFSLTYATKGDELEAWVFSVWAFVAPCATASVCEQFNSRNSAPLLSETPQKRDTRLQNEIGNCQRSPIFPSNSPKFSRAGLLGLQIKNPKKSKEWSASRTRSERDSNLHHLRHQLDQGTRQGSIPVYWDFPFWSARCPETPQKRQTHLKNEIGMNFGNKFPPPLTCGPHMNFTTFRTSRKNYHSNFLDYTSLFYFSRIN